jgi:hypothetical protein
MLRQCSRVVAVLGALSGLAACGGGSTSVPWINHRAALQIYRLVPHPASAPPCRAADLRLRVSPSEPPTQSVAYSFDLTNDGGFSCLIRASWPDVSATNAAGVRQLLRASHFNAFGSGVNGDLKPGEQASFRLIDSIDADCGGTTMPPAAVRFTHIIVTLPIGRVSADPGDAMSLFELCALSTTNVGRPANNQFPPAPGPAGIHTSLRPQLIGVLHTVRAGATFSYTILLYNRSSRRIVLHPCPGYTEDLAAFGNSGRLDKDVRRAYELNCRGSGAIAAHATVAYQMRFTVPAHAPAGPTELTWSLNTPILETPPSSAHAHPRVTRP